YSRRGNPARTLFGALLAGVLGQESGAVTLKANPPRPPTDATAEREQGPSDDDHAEGQVTQAAISAVDGVLPPAPLGLRIFLRQVEGLVDVEVGVPVLPNSPGPGEIEQAEGEDAALGGVARQLTDGAGIQEGVGGGGGHDQVVIALAVLGAK